MTQRGPWSVKGIDNRAREAAREAAREEGLTLGAYLNRLILEEGDEQDHLSASPQRSQSPLPQRLPTFDRATGQPSTGSAAALDRLTKRLESAETRSTLAITGIDQSVVGLLTRLENTEHSQQAMGDHIEDVLEDIRKTYDSLSAKIQRMESDNASATNLHALKSIEDALGKLASHVYQEGELVGEETNAIKMRLETGLHELSERMDGVDSRIDAAQMNANTSHSEELHQRMASLEADTSHRLAHVDHMATSMDSVHEQVNGAIHAMGSTLNEVQERLNQAETSTNDALYTLEQHFASLNNRLETVEGHAGAEAEAHQEMRRLFEDRFAGLTGELRGLIASTRAELAEEIEAATKAVDASVIAKLEESIGSLGARIDASEEVSNQTMDMVGETVARITDSVDQRLTANQAHHSHAIEHVGEQVSRISESLEHRLVALEQSGGNDQLREEMLQFTSTIDMRLDTLEARDTETIDRVRDEVEKLADHFDERVKQTEAQSANAIEQIGAQVAGVANRLEGRQTEALKAFSDKLDASQKRRDARLSSALDSVSERLERLQAQSSATISPVQRAIAALAHRIEAMEDFTAPPFVERETVDERFENAFNKSAAEPVDLPPIDLDDREEASPFTLPQTDELESLLSATDEENQEDHELSKSEDDFEAGYESWADEAAPDRDETVLDMDDLADKGEDDTEYYSAPPPPIDLAAVDALWDDGGDEARDSDIFGDDALENENTEADDNLASIVDDEIGPLELEADESPSLNEMATPAAPADYIAKARKAAKTAAYANAGSSHGSKKRSSGSTPGGSRRPAIAAVSTLAVAAIAGTSGVLYMRGQQETPPLQLDAQIQDSEAVSSNSATVLANKLNDEPAETALDNPGTAPPEASLTSGDIASDPDAEAATIDSSDPLFTSQADPTSTALSFSAPEIPLRPTLVSAATEGNGIAQFQLGMANLEAGNPGQAADLIETAATSGLAVAQHELAILHEQGLGTTRDISAARDWHRQAAENGNVQAMFDFASYNAEDNDGPQSDKIAADFFRKAAETGHTNSQYNLALMFATGRGVSPSQVEALYWLELAAIGGDTDASAAAEQLLESGAVSAEAARQVRERAAVWIAAPADPVANGVFGKQPWEVVSAKQIRPAQQVLNALGFDAGPPDGAMGEQTRNALRQFQAENEMDITGTLTDDVVQALNAAADARRGA